MVGQGLEPVLDHELDLDRVLPTNSSHNNRNNYHEPLLATHLMPGPVLCASNRLSGFILTTLL